MTTANREKNTERNFPGLQYKKVYYTCKSNYNTISSMKAQKNPKH